MKEYLFPAGCGEFEYIEKRSRFIGRVWEVSCEEEAKSRLVQVRARYHDARHHCSCYRVLEGNIERYCDDGEPQGTAGQPMLSFFVQEGIWNVCCVVTRYFGGILLGAGGLSRAYAKSAKGALEVAGTNRAGRVRTLSVRIPYSFLEQVKLELFKLDAVISDTRYGEDVALCADVKQADADFLVRRLAELTSGVAEVTEAGESIKVY